MELFKKSKKNLNLTDENLTLTCLNFYKAIENYQSDVINDKKYELKHFEKDIVLLVSVANSSDDIRLMTFVSQCCDVFYNKHKDLPINEVAQITFSLYCLSMELRNRYRKQKQVLEAITNIGLANLQYVERLPIYKKVLAFISENAQELADNAY